MKNPGKYIPRKDSSLWIFLGPVYFAVLAGSMLLDFSKVTPFLFLGVPALLLLICLVTGNTRTFFALLIVTIPLSPRAEFTSSGIGISFPFEPLLLLAFPVAVFIIEKKGILRERLNHPLTLFLLVEFTWNVFTSITSTTPLYSYKFLVNKLIYLMVFFLLPLALTASPRQLLNWIFLYGLGMFPLLLYAMYRHAEYNFVKEFTPDIATPFMSDHTIYANVLCMLLIAFGVAFLHHKTLRIRVSKKLIGIYSAFLLLALVLSFSRAAWLSALVALAFWGLLWLGARKWHFVCMALAGIVWAGLNFNSFYQNMKETRQRKYYTVSEHFQSVGNLGNDESNLERINRWTCAYQMLQARPLMGFGPSAYETNYGKYQHAAQLTSISTFTGDKGDAHSELFTALSEQGIPGGIIWTVHIFLVLGIGIQSHQRLRNSAWKWLNFTLLLAFLAFFVHSFVNDFIELDEFAPLFWFFHAALIIANVQSRKISYEDTAAI